MKTRTLFIAMKIFIVFILFTSLNEDLTAQADTTAANNQIEINKQIVNGFYQDLWFTNNTGNYARYVADEFIAHDIGDRKNSLEPAIEQKQIADFFWKHTTNNRTNVDFQIAEGDLVATRWNMAWEPNTLFGRILLGKGELPIINVMRIENGQIVEFWNHRHDIDTRMARLPLILRGFVFGLLIALVPTFIAFRQSRTLKKLRAKSETEQEA
jgi:predicted SnoaL-like aldol condensation-catalyzing enzyme